MQESFPLKTFKNTVAVLGNSMDYLESQSIAYMVMENAFNLSKIDITSNRAFSPSDQQQLKYQVIMNRLATNEPIQYILKEADFYGRKFKVNSSVLIPRQETEMLVQMLRYFQNWDKPKITDIGTGSGCIACSLSLEIPGSEVTAFDVSSDALKVAAQNAKTLGAKIQFKEIDILKDEFPLKDLDLVVSNPPYVTHVEQIHMRPNVLDYEPNIALFVSDEDPLVFYRAILEKVFPALKSGGVVFFEINEMYGKNIMLLCQHFGYIKPTIHKDLHEKQRFVSAIKP